MAERHTLFAEKHVVDMNDWTHIKVKASRFEDKKTNCAASGRNIFFKFRVLAPTERINQAWHLKFVWAVIADLSPFTSNISEF